MDEIIVDFKDIQTVLAPTFSGQIVRVVWESNGALLTIADPGIKCLRAKGIGHRHANINMIHLEGENAWAEAAVEKHKRGLNEHEEDHT